MQSRNLTPAQEAALQAVQRSYNEGLAEAAEDSGMPEAEIYGDIALATVFDLKDNDVAWEFLRRELGYVPAGLGRTL
jgi:hypothetical protein